MDKALARKSDPDTSQLAAAAVGIEHMEIAILIPLASSALGLTVSEIADKANFPRDSLSPRMRGLREKQLVRRTGVKRRAHRPFAKRSQEEYEITENGREVVKKYYAEKTSIST